MLPERATRERPATERPAAKRPAPERRDERLARHASETDPDAVIAAAEEHANRNGHRVVICVVDPSGEPVAMRRTEGAQVASSRVAIDKARTAAIFIRPSREMEDQVTNGRLGALALHGASCLTGGIPLKVGGEVVGADGGATVAGSHAPPDVIVEARTVGPAVVLEVLAGAEREDPAHLAQGAPEQLDVGVGSQVARAVAADVAGHRQARELLLHAHPHVREALVVLEQDVVVGPVLADERRFQQQRFDLGIGEDHVQVGGFGHQLPAEGVGQVFGQVAPHTLGEPPGLAHVPHAPTGVLEQVNPWHGWEIEDLLAQDAHGRLQSLHT